MQSRKFSDCGSEEFCKFAKDQLSCWPLARDNFRALKYADCRTISVNGLDVKVLFLPFRASSTKVDTSRAAIAARPCFLCLEHRPRQQKNLDFEGAKSKRYRVQLNPYPIFQNHFVIAADLHSPQLIWHRIVDMLRLSKRHKDFSFMYNGPKCGASVPDHFHFQAIPYHALPLEVDVMQASDLEYVTSLREAVLYRYPRLANGIFVIRGATSKSVAKLFYRLLDCSPVISGDGEPRFNLFTNYKADKGYTVIVVLRTCHRSSHYFSQDAEKHLTMSPGCADMGGVFVTVEPDDFTKLDSDLLGQMIEEVTISKQTQETVLHRLTRKQDSVEVDLCFCDRLEFEVVSDGAGKRMAMLKDGRIEYGGMLYDELFFEAKTSSTMFAGVSFVLHRCGRSRPYAGALKISVVDGALHVANVIGIEDFVLCVASSRADKMLAMDDAVTLVKSIRSKVEPFVKASEFSYCGIPATHHDTVTKAVDSTWE